MQACDIEWADNRIDRVTAVLHNVGIRPSTRPELSAAPVHLRADIPGTVVPEWFAAVAPRLSGDIGDDGIARVFLARRPGWGHVQVVAQLEGSTLWLHPHALVWRRRQLRLPARLPGYRVRLPELPRGLKLTGLDFGPQRIRLSGELAEWRLPVASLPSI